MKEDKCKHSVPIRVQQILLVYSAGPYCGSATASSHYMFGPSQCVFRWNQNGRHFRIHKSILIKIEQNMSDISRNIVLKFQVDRLRIARLITQNVIFIRFLYILLLHRIVLWDLAVRYWWNLAKVCSFILATWENYYFCNVRFKKGSNPRISRPLVTKIMQLWIIILRDLAVRYW